MKYLIIPLLISCAISTYGESGVKIITKDELRNALSTYHNKSNIKITANKAFGNDAYATIPSDNGGNYGDLLHGNRQNGDILVMRETLINEFTSSGETDMYWYGNFPARLSHVRALNFGRERGYTLQIVTRNSEGYAEVYVRIPPFKIIRMLIEVYGLP